MSTTFIDAASRLRQLFRDSWGSRNLVNVAPADFHAHIRQRIGTINARSEGFLDESKQRDLSRKYHWGHNHDFGDGTTYDGRMKDRHIDLIARFVTQYGLPLDLRGKRVMDIGVWTGGTCLTLVAMGAEVVGLEEVAMYADTVNYLAESFGVADRLKCLPRSLYDALPLFADYFDYVLYSGVIYHVTDPTLSLRLIFSALKDGGRVFLETYGYDSPECLCSYTGPTVVLNGTSTEMNRGGWNYYAPSPSCLAAWCRDVGFEHESMGPVEDTRILGAAERTRFGDFCRAGLSKTTTR
jgi:SAM-dependent methyltransferase